MAQITELITSLVRCGMPVEDALRFGAIYFNEQSKNPERDDE